MFIIFRLCGRIFCYYCSSNYVMTKYSGKKERCCKECYSEHSAVVERFTAAELSPSDSQPPPAGAGAPSPPAPAPYKPTPRVTGERKAARVSDTEVYFTASIQKMCLPWFEFRGFLTLNMLRPSQFQSPATDLMRECLTSSQKRK